MLAGTTGYITGRAAQMAKPDLKPSGGGGAGGGGGGGTSGDNLDVGNAGGNSDPNSPESSDRT